MKILLLSALLAVLPAHGEIVLTQENSTILSGSISPFTLATAFWDLQKKPQDAEKFLVLYTPGGNTHACDDFSTAVSGLKNVKVIIIKAYSAGALISQLFTGERIIADGGFLMFHQVRVILQGFFTADELLSITQDFGGYSRYFDLQCKTRMTITQEQYSKNVTGKDWVINAPEALKVGAADRVEKVVCSKRLEKENPQVDSMDPDSVEPKKSFCKILTDLQPKGSPNHGKAPKTK